MGEFQYLTINGTTYTVSGAATATFRPSVSEDGILSWTNDKDLENPAPVKIQGPRGADGHTPVKGTDYWTAQDKQELKQSLTAAILTQEAGESESLVMSQKAVTDLVNDALGTNDTQYETVDSVEEMTDTGKSYVLASTGTIWVYGETGKLPTWTKNYADPTDQYWLQDTRLNSSNTTACEGMTTTNYIDTASDSDIVRVANFDMDTAVSGQQPAVSRYTNQGTSNSRSVTRNSDHFISEVDGIYSFKGYSGYLRFCGIPTNGDENVIITINEEIAYTAGYQWYDTGATPETAAGGNYVDLLVKVNENKAAVSELGGRVTALESGADTLTIPSFWQDTVDACIAKIKALQVGRHCVTFPFFSDNHTRDGKTQYAGMLIAHVMEACGIPYCFFGGDAITSALASTADSDGEFRAQAEAFRKAMSYIPQGRFCMALGNHEGYLKANPNISGSTRVDYDRDQAYEIFLRPRGGDRIKHFGGDGTYYYVDDAPSKVRFIVLNTNGIGNADLDAAQLAWFSDTALKFGEKGWAAVIISHVPITNHYEQSNITNSDAVIASVQAYINGPDENKADIVGWYSGHIHRDRIYTGVSVNDTDDTQGETMGFTQVTITSDHTGIAYPVGNSPTSHPVANDDQSHAIDFVTINKAERTVHLTRLGIGQDRSYTY